MSPNFSPEAPYPLIIPPNAKVDFQDNDYFAQWFSTELTLIHNIIIRGLNSIWLNAPLVPPSDTKDFIGYGLACVSLLRAHNKTQEEAIFPKFQQKLDMRPNVVQHLAFENQLKELETYLLKVQSGLEPYDYERLLELRAALGSVLIQHLHDEVCTVTPDRLGAFSREELHSIAKTMDEHKRDLRDSTTIFPFMVTHHRKVDAPDWPAMPASVKWFANHVGFHLHHGYWKFSPFTATGDLQAYPSHSH